MTDVVLEKGEYNYLIFMIRDLKKMVKKEEFNRENRYRGLQGGREENWEKRGKLGLRVKKE